MPDNLDKLAAQMKGGKPAPTSAPQGDPVALWDQTGGGQKPQTGEGIRAGSLSDTIDNIGTHLKNVVAGPYHALTDEPQDATEQGIANAASGVMGNVPGATRVALGAYRMLAKPTVDAITEAAQLRRQGGPQASILHGSTYDAKGNYVPTAGSKLVDAIPLYGPWSRNATNEVHQQGVIPAAAGVATDVLASKGVAKLAGAALKGAGATARYASATPEARAVAQTRALVPGSPSELLTRALKPPVTAPDFEAQVNRTLPAIDRQNPASGVGGFANAADAAKTQEQQWYQGLLEPHRNRPVDTTPMVAAQMSSIPATNAFETPGIIPATAEKASVYDMTPRTSVVSGPILDEFGKPVTRTVTTNPMKPTLGTLDDIRQDTNAKLNAFYAKSGGDKYAALSNPETARVNAVNAGARDLVYRNLSDASGVPEANIRANQSLYGDLKDVSDIANRRDTAFGRQNPYSLQESIALSGGNPVRSAIAYAGQRFLKNVTDSDALTNAALDRFRSPSGPTLQPRSALVPPVVSALGGGAQKVGAAIAKVPTVRNPAFWYAINPPRAVNRK